MIGLNKYLIVKEEAKWIFEDNQSASSADRELLIDYLSEKGIAVEGHFQRALRDSEGLAWRYPAFAVKLFPSDPILVDKLRLLKIRVEKI